MSLASPLAGPEDPEPRWQEQELSLAGDVRVPVKDDPYSDRVRCDHPEVADGAALGRALLGLAEACGRGRVVVLCRTPLESGLRGVGFTREARMPGFYRGTGACCVMGAGPDSARIEAEESADVRKVDGLVLRKASAPTPPLDAGPTRRATEADAPGIAELIAETFASYPTPSGDPGYIAADLRSGTPYRVVEEGGRVVACASADRVESARTAEITDCATRPECRGRGLMKALIAGLMDDLREIGYPTAFTLSRAVIPGVNLAFQHVGFRWRGRMVRSCRIGSGLEDMNVWSRRL